jgi:hypothetical protein
MAENVPVNQAKQAGIKKCLPAIEKITNFIIEGGNAGAHSFWHNEKPDSRAFTTAIERHFADGVVFTNVNVVPTADGECYVEYLRISNMNKSCLATAQGLEGAKYKGELRKDIAILEHRGVTVYLIPNASQCTMVRKEVIMDGLKSLS